MPSWRETQMPVRSRATVAKLEPNTVVTATTTTNEVSIASSSHHFNLLNPLHDAKVQADQDISVQDNQDMVKASSPTHAATALRKDVPDVKSFKSTRKEIKANKITKLSEGTIDAARVRKMGRAFQQVIEVLGQGKGSSFLDGIGWTECVYDDASAERLTSALELLIALKPGVNEGYH